MIDPNRLFCCLASDLILGLMCGICFGQLLVRATRPNHTLDDDKYC